MSFAKNKPLAIPLILFSITFIAIISGIFKLPPNSTGSEYLMDKIFYYSINIIFWCTGAFLLNAFIKKILWGKTFKINARSKTIGLIEDFVTAIIYVAAIGILMIAIFDQAFSVSLLFIFLLLLASITFFRPKFVKIFSKTFINSVHPFKIGDWIKLIHKSGTNTIVGEIIDFNRMTILLRSENDTLMMFPNILLDEFIIENYKGIKEETKFNVFIELNSNIPVERVKRILLAGTKQALSEINITTGNSPQILVNEISKDIIKYKIDFWIKPWETISPEKVKDLVLANVINHLRVGGIGFDLDNKEQNILKNIVLFSSLDDNEIEKLYKTAKKNFYTEGTAIIKQCEEGYSMYILAEGLLNVFIKTDEDISDEINVGTISPGQFFGEMSLFTGEPRSATVIAETDSLVYEITKDAFKTILESKPGLVNEFGRIIAERQSSNTLKLEELKNKKDSFIERIIAKIKSFFEL